MNSMKGLGRNECARLRPITQAELEATEKEVCGVDFWRAVLLGLVLSAVIVCGLTYFWRL